MLGHFGFSYIGLIYMLMLEIPNIMWARQLEQQINNNNIALFHLPRVK